MAKDKNSFLMYADMLHTFEALEDEEAGRLIKHLLRYVNDLDPAAPDKITKIAFEPIKQKLKRDLKIWEETREERSKAGKASAEKRKQKQQDSTNVEIVGQAQTNPTVNVSVSVSDKKKNDIEGRKLKFASTLEPFLKTYGRETLKSFYAYWTEPNKSNTKFRQELEKTWDLSRRLQTWALNDKNFKKPPNNFGAQLPNAVI